MKKQGPWGAARASMVAVMVAGALGVWSTAEAEPARLSFFFSATDEHERATYLDEVARFNATRSDVQVHGIPRLWQGYSIHDSYVRLLALEDPSVDICHVDVPWIPEFAYPGWLLPLDEHLPAGEAEAFVPAALGGGEYLGKLYGLPLSLKGNALFYRKDLLEAHGLEPPQTLAELDRQARLLQEAGEVSIGVALHGLYTYNDVFPFFWASGGEVVSPDGRVLLDSPVNRRVLEDFVGLFSGTPPAAPPLALFGGEWARDYMAPTMAFSRGEAGFVLTWTPDLRLLEAKGSAVRGKAGVMAVPGLKPGAGASNLGSWYLAVSRFSRHPKAAVDFVRHMTSAEAQRRRLEALNEVPARRALLEDPELRRRFPLLASVAPAMTQARSRPRVPNERELDGLVEAHLQRAIRGEQDAAEALAKAAAGMKARRLPPSAPPSAQRLPPVQTESRVLDPADPLRLALLLSGALLLVVLIVLRRHERHGLRALSTISSKLALVGSTTIIVLMLVAAGMATSHALQEQHRELADARLFYRDQMTTHARTLAKHLSLATSIISDLWEASEQGAGDSPLGQLMMASHFTDDLLFLQLVDAKGRVLHSDRDSLFLEEAESTGHFAPPPELAVDVQRQATALAQRKTEAGVPYLEVLVPVYRRGVHLGALRLGVSQATVLKKLRATEQRHERAIEDILSWAFGLTLGLALIGMLGILVLARRMARPIVDLTAKAERIRGGDLDVRFGQGPRDEIGTLTETMAEMVSGLRDRDFIRDAFGRYVTPQLADRFIADPTSLRLGGQVQQVTIMMTDLRGFTGLTTEMGPEGTVQLLNRYFACMTEVVMRYEGTITEFIGDAMLVLFGAPVSRPDDPQRAVTCAVAMQAAMVAFNAESRAMSAPELAMGVGLCTGDVVAGNIGSEQRVKYGVVGDPVNMAARIESLTVGAQVLVSDDTWDLVREIAEATGPTHAQVKGREEPLPIYEIRSIKGDPELVVPLRVDEQVAVDLEARCFLLAGKQVDGEASLGRLHQLGVAGAALEIARPLQPLDNLKLRIRLAAGQETSDIYAKVTAVDSAAGTGEGSVRVKLAFTGMGEEDLRAIEAYVAGEGEAGE